MKTVVILGADSMGMAVAGMLKPRERKLWQRWEIPGLKPGTYSPIWKKES